jgi:two-component system chemotaxis response regulator CheY
VLIVDDSEITRRILCNIIRSHYWDVCGEAENGWSGVKKFQELKPDIVVLDLGMPDISRIEAAKWMSESDPTVPLILFTLLDTEGMESAARGAGICAIVSKTEVWKLLTIETAIRLARISSMAQDHPVSANRVPRVPIYIWSLMLPNG